MPTSLLICDDSTMARKQVARSLPDGWGVDVTFATNGVEAIAAIKAGKGDILLLDLNMPKMDGYQVLETILKQDLPTLTIVISGDIQPEAHQRVKGLGALDFIKKPVDKSKLTEVLSAYGVFSKEDLIIAENEAAKLINQSTDLLKSASVRKPAVAETQQSIIKVDGEALDCYQEITNVAMGKAGDLLARLLDVVVVLPIPNVNLIEVSEITMALSDVENKDQTSGICQGFIGAGISGEALLIVNDSSFKDIASLMKYEHKLDNNVELELLMDMANLLIGACLSGIAEQLDMSFSQGHPVVLGQHRKISELIATNTNKWKKTLAIEISYSIENYPIKFDLLLLFTEQSLAVLNHKIAYLLD
jgi:chemotaxis protein CheY-P-specific phosphatase CheC/ActR/RegA family two-component response regulator